MTKRRNPRTAPTPLFIVSGMPDHISIDRGDDYFVIRCGRCGGSSRYGLPVTSTELQRLADEFGAAHRHEAGENFRGRIKVFRDSSQLLLVECIVILPNGDEATRRVHLSEIMGAMRNASRSDYGALLDEETHKPVELDDKAEDER